MAAIVMSIDISRRPADVFAFVTDPLRLPEWQESVVSVRREGDPAAPLSVGSRTRVTRRLGPREQPTTTQVTALDPPRRWATRVIDGPIRGIEQGTIEPLAGGERSRVTIALDFEAHGIGKLLVPLIVRGQARRQLPRNEQKLKELLERGA